MMSKRSVVVGLVGLNLFLLAALVLSTYSPPAAYAQRAGAANNFLAVTCRADNDYDVLFLLDLPTRKLHCFAPTRGDRSGKTLYAGHRDLSVDFNR